MHSSESENPTIVFIVHLSFIAVFAALCGGVLWVASDHVQFLSLITLAMAVLAWVLADIMTGFVHWGLDSYGSRDTWVLGPFLIHPFRLHHEVPDELGAYPYATTLGNGAILVIPAEAILLGLVILFPTPLVATLTVFFTFTFSFTILGNVSHRWAHAAEVPKVVRFLQRCRILLCPNHHWRHHNEHPFDRSYCILSGTFNVFFDRIGLFRRLENAIFLVFRIPVSDEQPDIIVKTDLLHS